MVMSFSKSEKKIINELINLFQSITNYYDCPSNCHGACCKECNITLAEPEYKKILRVRKDLKEILTLNVSVSSGIVAGRVINQYEFTLHPCPLLEGGRCSVHEISPIICKMYPFATKSNTPHGYITLDPCPVGIKIAIDFTIFTAYVNTRGISKTVFFTDDELFHLKEMSIASKEYQIHKSVKNIQIPREFLKPFAEYLVRSDKNSLEADRENLLKKIQTL
jgi:Fe-S-cluster containining protein